MAKQSIWITGFKAWIISLTFSGAVFGFLSLFKLLFPVWSTNIGVMILVYLSAGILSIPIIGKTSQNWWGWK